MSRRSVAAILAWQVTASVCYYAVFAATPFVREATGASRFLIGVLVTAATLGYTLLLFPSGAAVDGFGERVVMVGGLAGLGIGAAGFALADTFGTFLLAAFALGAAYATAMPATNRAVVATVPTSRRGVAMGVKQVGVTAGSGLSAVLVVSLAPVVATWRAGFWVAAGLAVLVAAGFAATYRGSGGTGVLSVPDLRGLGGDRAYVALVVAGLFFGAALFTTIGYVTLYLTESVGASLALAGLGFALVQATGSLGRIVAGGLADALGGPQARAAATVLVGQALLGAAVLAAMAVLTPGVGVAFGLLAALGLTVVGFTGLYYSCMTALVPEDAIGAATAGGQTALNAGALLAPPAFGLLADSASYRAGWGLLAVVVAVAATLLVVVRRRTG